MTNRDRINECKRADESLCLFIDNAPAAFALFDSEMRYLAVSDSWLKDFGLERASVIGCSHYEIFPEISEEWKQVHRRCLAGAVEKAEADRFERADGSVQWVRWEVRPWRRADETIGGIVIFSEVITERKALEDTQSFLLQCGWPSSGEDFFLSLARYLADTLSADFVCIDRLSGDCLSAETVAVYFDGKFEDNMSYALKDTPCGDVVGETICCFPRDVRGLFPNDEVLQDMMAEGYIGTTLWSSQGEPIGLIALISRIPLANPERAAAVLKMVSVRAAGELERKAAEEALKQSEERLTLAQNAGHIGIFDWDILGEKIVWTRELEEIFGIPVGSFDGNYESWVSRVLPEDLEWLNPVVEDAFDSGRTDMQFAYRFLRPDGEIRWVEVRAQILRNDASAPYRLIGTNVDVTERRRVEEELRRLSLQLDLHMENSPLAVVEWDPEYRITRWSDEAQRVFGWSAEEMLGKHIDDVRLVYEEDWHIVAKLMEDMNAGIRPRNVNPNRNYRKDGGVIYCEWYNSVLRDSAGEVISVLSLILDVTGRLDAEEKLKRQVLLLQRAIAPANPTIVDGYSAASAYIPAYSGEEIGGDFYDIFRTEEGKVGILIGDVSGKGIEAAALASEARNAIRAFAYESSSPAMALGHANSLLARHGSTQFATVFLIVLDPATGEFTYSGGGHPPALVCRGCELVEQLISRGLPIGLFDGLVYSEASSRLDSGDKLVLYTDGVSEARNDGEMFGHEGILRVAGDHCDDKPDALVNRIVSAAREWANGYLADDTAVVLVTRD